MSLRVSVKIIEYSLLVSSARMLTGRAGDRLCYSCEFLGCLAKRSIGTPNYTLPKSSILFVQTISSIKAYKKINPLLGNIIL